MSIFIMKEIIFYVELILYYMGFYLTMDYKYPNHSTRQKVLVGVSAVTGLYIAERIIQHLDVVLTGQPYISTVITFLLGFFLSYLFFIGNLKNRIWGYCIYILPGILSELFILPVMLKVLAKNPLYDISIHLDLFTNELTNAVCTVLISQVLVCFWILLILLTKVVIKKSWPLNYFVFLFFPIYEAYMVLLFYRNCEVLDKSLISEGFGFFILGIILNTILVAMLYRIKKASVLEAKYESLQKQRQIEKVYNSMILQSADKISKLRHDFKNHLQVIYTSISMNTKEETIAILDSVSDKVNATAVKKYCDNHLVNTILTLKADEATKEGISFECECSVPNDLKIDSADLCSIYINILDNAIEASKSVSNQEDRKIILHSHLQGNIFSIKAQNHYEGKVFFENDKPITTKKDSSNHGIGSSILKEIVDNYDGEIKYSTSGNIFEILIMIRLETSNETGNH